MIETGPSMNTEQKMVLEVRRWGNEMYRTIRVMRLMELQIILTKETLIIVL